MNNLNCIDSLNIKGSLSVLGEIKLPDSLSVCVNYVDNIAQSADTEFWKSEFWLSITIPAIVSICIFILGNYFKNRHEQQLAVNETVNYRLIVFTWVDSIKSNIEKQIKSCLDFASKLEKSQEIHPEQFFVYRLLADEMNSIGIDRFIKTFMINSTNPWKNNDENLFNIVSQLRFISSVESELKISYDKYEDYIKSLMEEWNSNLLNLFDLLNQLLPIYLDPKEHSEFCNSVVVVYIKYQQKFRDKDPNVIQVTENLLEPLRDIIDKELNINRSNQSVVNLARVIRNLDIIILKWKTYASGTVDLFKDKANNLSNSYNKLVEAKTYFKIETKVKKRGKIKK